ncbi:hypothetical protein AALO_G00003200 [Alosa alosa]|uniref:Retrotransposon gag domain-containing protein n=1 Tax=Alosa alosa TaxID=278164 RepID=A0AAV6HDQ3_9TELE|nr:hypothetical protein AALO_G00003200 [Alosa alosa]
MFTSPSPPSVYRDRRPDLAMQPQNADPFRELVNEFRQALTAAQAHPAPPPAVPSSPVVNPTPYSGAPEGCKGFLLQCSLALEMQAHRFPTERSRIAYIISLLSGRALQWAESAWSLDGPATTSVDDFVEHFAEVFGLPEGDSSAQAQLHALREGKRPVTEYSLQFRTLAAASGWNEAALITAFRQGLEPNLRLQLSTYDDAMGLERFIQLAVRVAHRRDSCLQELRSAPSPVQAPPRWEASSTRSFEPMQVDTVRLTPTKRHRRLTQGLCLYCGASDHIIAQCSTRPPRPVLGTSSPAPSASASSSRRPAVRPPSTSTP